MAKCERWIYGKILIFNLYYIYTWAWHGSSHGYSYTVITYSYASDKARGPKRYSFFCWMCVFWACECAPARVRMRLCECVRNVRASVWCVFFGNLFLWIDILAAVVGCSRQPLHVTNISQFETRPDDDDGGRRRDSSDAIEAVDIHWRKIRRHSSRSLGY